MNNSAESKKDDHIEKILNDLQKYMIKFKDVSQTGIKIANEFGIIDKPQNNQNNEDIETENGINYDELTKQNLKIKNIEDKLNIIEHKIKEITSKIENKVEFLKLKSANIEDKTSSYIFWYNLSHEKLDEFLDDIKNLSDKNVNISIYSKSNAHE